MSGLDSSNPSLIDHWLQKFKSGWIEKDVDKVKDLFSDEVEYWENPYKQLVGKEKIRAEWEIVRSQENIQLETSVYLNRDNRHTVLWQLSYNDVQQKLSTWAGLYLIELDERGKCNYFYQVGEKQL